MNNDSVAEVPDSEPSPADTLSQCPICFNRFPRSVIEFHASECIIE